MKFVLFWCILFLNSISICYTQTTLKPQNGAKTDPERLWDLAIEAKGGREKLYAVQNMVVASSSTFKRGKKKINIQLEDLYVFPNKWWSWNDQRPSYFGLTVSMYNWAIGKEYVVTDGEPVFKGLQPISSNLKNTNLAGLITDLLETKWNQPKPENAFAGKINGKAVDIIQTTLLGKRIDFALDRESHLPVRITAYSDTQKPTTIIQLEEYLDIDGIKMASKVVFKHSDGDIEYKRQYQFNVQYNEAIFTTPPSFEDGREAWKMKN